MLWDVFYVPDMGAHPVAQMCMESAARQTTFNLQLASQLDQEDRLTITTFDFRFRYQTAALFAGLVLQVQIFPPDRVEVVNSLLHVTSCTTGNLWLKCGLSFACTVAIVCSKF